MGQRVYNQDIELIFEDGGAARTADGAGKVGGTAVIKDMGAGRFEGVMIFDVSALDIASADESYALLVQGSNKDDFSSGIENLAGITLGATASRPGGAQDSVAGRYEVPFCTEQADSVYQYVRVYLDAAGTTPSITYKAWCAEKY